MARASALTSNRSWCRLCSQATSSEGAVEIISKPEVFESGGVVPTPRFIADEIVQRTIGPALAGKSPDELDNCTVADICCGSGIFLLSVFEFLTDHYLSWYQVNDRGLARA